MKEDKPPDKGQAESTSCIYTLYRKSPLKEDNLSTKDKTAGLESVLITVHTLFFLTAQLWLILLEVKRLPSLSCT